MFDSLKKIKFVNCNCHSAEEVIWLMITGSVVCGCSPDGAAARAGVQCGDIIVKVTAVSWSYQSVCPSVCLSVIKCSVLRLIVSRL